MAMISLLLNMSSQSIMQSIKAKELKLHIVITINIFLKNIKST